MIKKTIEYIKKTKKNVCVFLVIIIKIKKFILNTHLNVRNVIKFVLNEENLLVNVQMVFIWKIINVKCVSHVFLVKWINSTIR